MNRTARLVAALAVSAALLTTAGCDKLRARDQLNKGVVAYKALQFESAIEHFKNAVRYDPELKVAKLYLATAYSQQYVPGADDPDSLRNVQLAIKEYQDVLKEDPGNPNSLLGIAYLYMSMKKFDEARGYYKKAIAADPNNPDAYYSVGVIDWIAAKDDIAARKNKVGLKLDDPLPPKNRQVCEDIKTADGAKIDEGMKMLELAMQKREDYDDAMAYLNLLYRRKADTECGNPDAAIADSKLADEWVNKAMAARKKKMDAAAKKTGGGIVIDQPNPTKK